MLDQNLWPATQLKIRAASRTADPSQVDALQNLMANGASVIVFAPLDTAGIVPVVKKANEAGVLVFSIDDSPAGGMVTATVRADNVDAGAQGGKEMAKRLEGKACWADGRTKSANNRA